MDTGVPIMIVNIAIAWISFPHLGTCSLTSFMECGFPNVVANIVLHPYQLQLVLQVFRFLSEEMAPSQPLHIHHLRLALAAILQLSVNGLALFAPDCSSWGVPARGTSKRSFINVFGNIYLKWVQDSGCMVSRMLCRYLQPFKSSRHVQMFDISFSFKMYT